MKAYNELTKLVPVFTEEPRKRNLYILKTKKGNIKIWSELEPEQFYKSLKLKKNEKKKNNIKQGK